MVGIGPGLHHLENKQIIFVHEAGIDHLAFQIGETLGDPGVLAKL